MRLRKIYLMLLIAMFFIGACGGGGAAPQDGGQPDGGGGEPATVVDAATAGSINGTVSFTGTAPEPELIQMDAEPSCQEQYTEGPFTETAVVNSNGTLANVFVYVKSGLEGMNFPAPSQSVVLDQQGCRYHPHVLGVQTNQTVVIRNSDDVLHNIHPEPVNSRPFNVGQPVQGMETERSFDAAEIMIPVACDVHDWMSAYIGVVDHPYFAVTGTDGSFSLPNLPPGTYTLEAWHELYGTQTMEVTVGEKESVDVEFSYSGG